MKLTPQQACYFAHALTRLGEIGQLDRLSTTLFDSKVDLNPHQIDAALFALANPLQRGVVLADEVGLGKTIEAGLVLCQRWAERKRRLVVICPAHIRKQWQTELSEKFNLPAIVVDSKVSADLQRQGRGSAFEYGRIVVISYGYAARVKDELRAIPFDLVVFDEAHKLRNAYQASRKGGQAVRWAFELRDKLLLTATPLQNSLMELYGLGWIIDDHVFGDRNAFQNRYCNAGGDLDALRTRLSQFCKRTLRKDCPYIDYKRRQAMTHPFPQTEDEKTLHQDVLQLMRREVSFAFPQRQRHLIEIILFKTLASSTHALASTLRTLRDRLIALRDGAARLTEEELLDTIAADQEVDLDVLFEQLDQPETPPDSPSPSIPGKLLAEELAQIESLIARAERIGRDSKSRALLTALTAAFDRLEQLGARRKAVIFTESRRTQAALAEYLEANGYNGKVVVFNGSNSHPSAKSALERFTAAHQGTDKLTGSRAIDVRSALIEEFRERAEILLATEAASEGVNLQFCSLVVNYDLPWNPQRIEQRIGRCHRYGQRHDVVVVNFLAQDNLADRRVQELLQQKFSLFDGLFGASDEVLGTIEEGGDFERRVAQILKTCRTDAEIASAFDTLQRELAAPISSKMAEARQQLLEHFDVDVHERLRVGGEEARAVLDRVGQRLWRLAHWALENHATLDDATSELRLHRPPSDGVPTGVYRLAATAGHGDSGNDADARLLRLSSPLGQWILETAKSVAVPVSTVRFHVSTAVPKVSMIAPLVGRAGWLRLDKLAVQSDEREEYLLFTAVTDDGENLDQEQAGRLLDGQGEILSEAPPAAPESLSARLAADAERIASATLNRATESSNKRFKEIQTQINQWADDKMTAAELELSRIKRELRSARRDASLAETVLAKQELESQVATLERQQRRQRQQIFDLEDEVEQQRTDLIAKLSQRIAQRSTVETLFTMRWDAV